MSSIKSLERAIDILFSFSGSHPEQTPLEIAEKVGIPVPSVYRFLHTFVKKGLLDHNKKSGHYSLGFDLLRLEAALRNKFSMEQIMKPVLESIVKLTEETVQITILNKDYGMLLFSEDSPNPPRFVPEFGSLVPLYAGCTVQVIMAYLPEEQIESIIAQGIQKIGPRSILSADELRERLAEIRKDGYAVSYEEFYPGSLGISTPIFLADGKIFASLSVSGPVERLEHKQESVLQLLQEKSALLSERLALRSIVPMN
ncbi:MAG: IclR family transcriptional regulator [Sphaerochaetaceae bacterium]|jgi:IclR family KDG regulon transcriptional repressor